MKYKGNSNNNIKSLEVIKEEESLANYAKTLSSAVDNPVISEIIDGEDIDFEVG